MGEFQAKRVITENFSSLPVNQFGIRNKFWGRGEDDLYYLSCQVTQHSDQRTNTQTSPRQCRLTRRGGLRWVSPDDFLLQPAGQSSPRLLSHSLTAPHTSQLSPHVQVGTLLTADSWWLLIILWQCFRQLSSGNGNGTTVPLSPLLNIHKLNWYRSLGFKQE